MSDMNRGGSGTDLETIESRVQKLTETIDALTAVCKESLEYTQRYQRNTVSVLQEENKQKDKYITGILLIDLLKPVAEVCAKIERRMKKCAADEQKFLTDLLEEIEDTAIDEYGVEIRRTEVGQPRPENIAKVDSVTVTHEETLKNTVAESLSASWMLNGRIILKERVIMYKYEPAPEEPKNKEPKDDGSLEGLNEATDGNNAESKTPMPEQTEEPISKEDAADQEYEGSGAEAQKPDEADMSEKPAETQQPEPETDAQAGAEISEVSEEASETEEEAIEQENIAEETKTAEHSAEITNEQTPEAEPAGRTEEAENDAPERVTEQEAETAISDEKAEPANETSGAVKTEETDRNEGVIKDENIVDDKPEAQNASEADVTQYEVKTEGIETESEAVMQTDTEERTPETEDRNVNDETISSSETTPKRSDQKASEKTSPLGLIWKALKK